MAIKSELLTITIGLQFPYHNGQNWRFRKRIEHRNAIVDGKSKRFAQMSFHDNNCIEGAFVSPRSGESTRGNGAVRLQRTSGCFIVWNMMIILVIVISFFLPLRARFLPSLSPSVFPSTHRADSELFPIVELLMFVCHKAIHPHKKILHFIKMLNFMARHLSCFCFGRWVESAREIIRFGSSCGRSVGGLLHSSKPWPTVGNVSSFHGFSLCTGIYRQSEALIMVALVRNPPSSFYATQLGRWKVLQLENSSLRFFRLHSKQKFNYLHINLQRFCSSFARDVKVKQRFLFAFHWIQLKFPIEFTFILSDHSWSNID